MCNTLFDIVCPSQVCVRVDVLIYYFFAVVLCPTC